MPDYGSMQFVVDYYVNLNNQIEAENQTISGWLLNHIPTNGNFSGNGYNDAWDKADAIKFATTGSLDQIERTAAGSLEAYGYLNDYKAWSQNNGNIDPLGARAQSALDEEGMAHDLSPNDTLAHDLVSNTNYSAAAVDAALYGNLYGVLAAPFIGIGASALSVVTHTLSAISDSVSSWIGSWYTDIKATILGGGS